MPIVALTASRADDDRDRCLAAGMDGYVAKPIRARDLFAAVESLGSQVSAATESRGNGASSVVVDSSHRTITSCAADDHYARHWLPYTV